MMASSACGATGEGCPSTEQINKSAENIVFTAVLTFYEEIRHLPIGSINDSIVTIFLSQYYPNDETQCNPKKIRLKYSGNYQCGDDSYKILHPSRYVCFVLNIFLLSYYLIL